MDNEINICRKSGTGCYQAGFSKPYLYMLEVLETAGETIKFEQIHSSGTGKIRGAVTKGISVPDTSLIQAIKPRSVPSASCYTCSENRDQKIP